MTGKECSHLQIIYFSISILKAGVGIAGDAKLIWNQYGILSQGCVDIQAIAQREDRIESCMLLLIFFFNYFKQEVLLD